MKIPCIKSYIVVGIFEDLEDLGEWSAPLEIKKIQLKNRPITIPRKIVRDNSGIFIAYDTY